MLLSLRLCNYGFYAPPHFCDPEVLEIDRVRTTPVYDQFMIKYLLCYKGEISLFSDDFAKGFFIHCQMSLPKSLKVATPHRYHVF